MSEQKHTPGPWSFEPHGNTIALYSGRSHGMNGKHGLRLMNLDDGDRNFGANARLIAAAPDMLEALKMALNFLENTESELGITLESAGMARSAISKALTP